MNALLKTRTARVLFATGLASGAIGAQAASGFTVSESQESLVHAGMSRDEVRQAVGQPARHEHFMNEAGPTWTYDVAASSLDQKVFDVDFGADGRVQSASERILLKD